MNKTSLPPLDSLHKKFFSDMPNSNIRDSSTIGMLTVGLLSLSAYAIVLFEIILV